MKVFTGPILGSLRIICNQVPISTEYFYQYALPGGTWITVSETKRSCLITGLQHGKKYTCRVGVEVNGMIVYTEPKTIMVN